MTVTMHVHLRDDAVPDEHLDEMTTTVRADLLCLEGTVGVTSQKGTAPEGARAGTAVELGALLVTCKPAADALASVVSTLGQWVHLRPKRSVEVEVNGQRIALQGHSAQTERELVDAWVAAVAEAT
jgi:hypothetical protein